MSSMKMTTVTGARRALARRPIFTSLAAAFAVSVLTLAACEGDNLFSGGPAGRLGSGNPVVSDIITPATVREGDVLDVRVKAIAPGGMAKITVRYRRAVNAQEEFTFTGTRTDTVTVDATRAIPETVSDSILIVEAIAEDLSNRVSAVKADTVRVLSRTAPIVSVTVTPTGSVSVGDTLRIRVSARDNFGLQAVGYVVLDEDGDTISGPRYVNVSGVQRDTVFIVVLPAGVAASSVSVIGLAINSQALRGASSPLAVSVVDKQAPSVRILAPLADEPTPLADSVLVRVHVVDSGGIADIRLKGVAIRRDSLMDNVIVTRYIERTIQFPQPPSTRLPTDTIVSRYLRPAADSTSEPVFIIATVRDAGGNTSADTVRIIDGPRVAIVTPAPGAFVSINSRLLVRLTASDRVSGLDSLKLLVSGVQQEIITLRNLAPLQAIDTTVSIDIGSTTGSLTLQAGVWNRVGIGGFGQPLNLTVSSTAVSDTVLPRVLRIVQTSERLELDDSIRVTVRATDGAGSGIRRMGVVMFVVPDDPQLPPRTLVRTTESFNPPLSGTPERVFYFRLNEAYAPTQTALPRKFTLQVHAFAVDASGNCGASVSTTLSALPCDLTVQDGLNYFTARGGTPPQLQVTGVAGQSVSTPGGGKIADAIVDTERQSIYLSNVTNNRIDVFQISTNTFEQTGSGACGFPAESGWATCRGVAGAAPWGLFLSTNRDTLIVANSGGTNISFLSLNPGPRYLREEVQRRVLTPNVVLWELTETLTETGLKYEAKWLDYSDRPQFVAQHKDGYFVYSTLPTTAARDGTIRVADTDPDPAASDDLPEGYILYPANAITPGSDSWAIANIDSIIIRRPDNAPDTIIIWDHVPGYYDRPGATGKNISVRNVPLLQMIDSLKSKGSDIVVHAGNWNTSKFTLADTTFIAASGNRNKIAIGEGSREPGRIFMCCESNLPQRPLSVGISNDIQVQDLINNAAERVFGLGLNQDGSYGIARGSQAAYYFTENLRLQGEFRSGIAGGAGGAAFHPLHASPLATDISALSFAATPNRTIKIIDSTHFYERGEIAIRDNIVGPVRAFAPDASENVGLDGPNTILLKLIGVTAGDNVVIVNVRAKDVR